MVTDNFPVDASVEYKRHMKRLGPSRENLIWGIHQMVHFYLTRAFGIDAVAAQNEDESVTLTMPINGMMEGPTPEQLVVNLKELDIPVTQDHEYLYITTYTLASAYALQGLILFSY